MATSSESIELSQLPPQPIPTESLANSKATSFISHASDQPLDSTGHSTDVLSTSLGRSTSGSKQSALPPVDRGRDAWLFVAAATVLETFIWGFGICFSVFLVHLENTEPWSRFSLAALSSIGTIQLGLMFFLTFFVNNAFRRYPDKAQLALYISAAVYPLSLLLSSFATQVWGLILTQGLLAGISGAVVYAPCLLWTMDWFVERRGLATGIVFSGTGLGGASFPFILGALLEKFGFAWTCRIWALISGVALGLAAYFVRPRIPPPKFSKGQPRPKWFLVNLKTLNHPINYVMMVTTMLASISYFPVSLYLPIYTQSVDPSNTFLPNVVAATFNLVAFLASMAIGYASDKSLSATATFVGVTGGAVALGAWSTADSLAKVFIFAAIFGATTPISSYWGAATREIGGSDPYISGNLLCFWGMIRGLASIFSPFLSAALYNRNEAHSKANSYGFRDMIIFVGTLSLVSSIGGIALGFLKRKSNAAKRRGAATA
ncbi:hypothetical protein JCM5350_008372 [Sporobolomyces pararoseus]